MRPSSDRRSRETKIGLLDLLKIYPVKDARPIPWTCSPSSNRSPRVSIPFLPHRKHIAARSISRSPAIRSAVNGEMEIWAVLRRSFQLMPGQTVEFYIHPNSQFRLPAPETDIIMIGPGTGIAPFRVVPCGKGQHGSQRKELAFLRRSAFYHRLPLPDGDPGLGTDRGAHPRSIPPSPATRQEKVYVQHKMQRNGAELYHVAPIRRACLCLRRQRADERGCGGYPAVHHPAGRKQECGPGRKPI